MLTTHVLDIARGTPAAGIAVELYSVADERRTLLARAVTNADGRTDEPLAREALPDGWYEIVFATESYFARNAVEAFYGDVSVRFHLVDGAAKYHVPLLLSPWGYSTYRGS
ncbi:MAG: hydroxyisourate hydrolase [Candidatus Eremiobacteraeota bacterium]|nr:hydroxyisourate hydrolase [Candidatus Eremiobacteraeota bacterium]